MTDNLYASLAQHLLDPTEKAQASQLADFTSMLSNLPLTSFDGANSWLAMTKQATNVGDVSTTSTSVCPFDSPLDQSLASPASSRDYHQSPLDDLEYSGDFDFGSMDAPLFPDHGTQQTQNENLLSGLPLFGTEFAFSQMAAATNNSNLLTLSQQTVSAAPPQPSAPIATAAGPSDFSFDNLARSMAEYHEMAQTPLREVARATSPSVQSAYSSSQASDQQDEQTIHAAAANFVRQFARSAGVRDVDVLVNALRVAGITVSDEVVAEILTTVSISQSRSPSPTTFSSSPFASQTDSHVTSSPSVSPMVLPAATKVRSSIQRANLSPAGQASSLRRFVCPTCNKDFDRQYNLRTHTLTHVDPNDRDKPYMCPWQACSKPFIRKYDAERHYKSVHVRRNEIATAEEVEMALSGEHGILAPSSTSSDVEEHNDQACG